MPSLPTFSFELETPIIACWEIAKRTVLLSDFFYSHRRYSSTKKISQYDFRLFIAYKCSFSSQIFIIFSCSLIITIDSIFHVHISNRTRILMMAYEDTDALVSPGNGCLLLQSKYFDLKMKTYISCRCKQTAI